MSETTQLYAALVQAQTAIAPVEKGSTNAFHKYKYASGDDIIAAGRAALNGAGLAAFAVRWTLTETPFEWADDKGVLHPDVSIRLLVHYRLVHTSGEALDFEPFSVPVLPEKGRPIDKAEAGARTYALSYFLRDLLLIPRVDEGADNDQRDDSKHELKPRAPITPMGWKPTQPERQRLTLPEAVAKVLGRFPNLQLDVDQIGQADLTDDEKVTALGKLYANEKKRAQPEGESA